ncbi:UNVERIFIED_CONTAM: hypothetical protein NCL1_51810 [Trichonephila clavipes]
MTCAVTSTHITLILESLPKPGYDTLGDSKFLGYFQLGTSTFESSNNSTTEKTSNLLNPGAGTHSILMVEWVHNKNHNSSE